MRPKLSFFVTPMLHLSLESFYREGVTPEEAKEAIEGIRNRNYYCEQGAINRNWNVTNVRNPEQAAEEIELALNELIYAKRASAVGASA